MMGPTNLLGTRVRYRVARARRETYLEREGHPTDEATRFDGVIGVVRAVAFQPMAFSGAPMQSMAAFALLVEVEELGPETGPSIIIGGLELWNAYRCEVVEVQ